MRRIGMFLFFMSILFLFTGCPDEGLPMYSYEPSNFKINANKVQYINFIINNGQYNNGEYYYKIYGYAHAKTDCRYLNVNNDVRITIPGNTFKPGDEFMYTVGVYSDRSCQTLVKEYNTSTFTAISGNEISKDVQDIITKVGGQSQYCNIDWNGNYETVDSNLFVKVAYSQIDYVVGSTKGENVSKCRRNPGELNGPFYSKYGDAKNASELSLKFVYWVASKSKVNLPKFSTVKDLINWAEDNGRLYDDISKLHDGDLVLEYDSYSADYEVKPVYLDYGRNGVYWLVIGYDYGDAWSRIDEYTTVRSTSKFISMEGLVY